MTEKEKELLKLVEGIVPADKKAMEEAQKRQDALVKVPGSLGKLEDISIKIAGITGKPFNNKIKKKAILVMCADNGVVAEGVAVAPQFITKMQTINMIRRITGVSALAKHFHDELLVIDVGVKEEIPEALKTDDMIGSDGHIARRIVNRSLGKGTKNLARENAMSREQAVNSILIGIEAAKAAKMTGISIIGVGEMGIGNTTTSSALTGSMTGKTAKEVTGRGGGLNDEGLRKKLDIIDAAIHKAEGEDAIGKLAMCGGFDIGAMAGAFLGAAIYKLPVVIDGLISATAALLAKQINPTVTDYMFASHVSKEPGYLIAIDKLGLDSMLNLDMRLGEGSGCPIAFQVIEGALGAMNYMKTFAEGKMDDTYLEEVRENNLF